MKVKDRSRRNADAAFKRSSRDGHPYHGLLGRTEPSPATRNDLRWIGRWYYEIFCIRKMKRENGTVQELMGPLVTSFMALDEGALNSYYAHMLPEMLEQCGPADIAGPLEFLCAGMRYRYENNVLMHIPQ